MGYMGHVGEKKERRWCDKWGDEGLKKPNSSPRNGESGALGLVKGQIRGLHAS